MQPRIIFAKKALLTVSIIFLFGQLAISQTAEKLLSTTQSFIETLDPDQKNQVMFSMEDSMRTKWTNLPLGLSPRAGLRYGDLSEESMIEFHKILSAIFSSQGYLKNLQHYAGG